jgi:hypothetical protein
MKKILPYSIFEAGRIPAQRKFYVSFRLDHTPDTVSELMEGKMLGVQGISNSKSNVCQWFTFTQAMLVMPYAETIGINNLDRIEYENADFVLQDHCRVYMRVHDCYDQYSFVDNIARGFSYALKTLATFHPDKKTQFDDLKSFVMDDMFDQDVNSKLTSSHINSLDDLTDIMHTLTRPCDAALDYAELREMLRMSILCSMHEYSLEEEWLVRDNILRVPEKSVLYIWEGGVVSDSTVETLREKYRVIPVRREHICNVKFGKADMQSYLLKMYSGITT